MSKIINIFAILFISTCALQQFAALPVEAPETLTLFDDELREFMEFVRLQMKCGYKAAGIPPLAPYQTAFKSYQFGNIDGQGNDAWSLRGNFTELSIIGLDEFDVRHLSWNNVKQKITFDFYFEQLLIQSPAYQMDLFTKMFGPVAHIYGDGVFNLALQNVRMYGSFKLLPRLSGGIRVGAFNVNVELAAAKSKATGVMNSKLYTKLFNSWIEEFIQITFNDNPAVVSGYVENLLVPPMNKGLQNVSMAELIAIILGLAGEVAPNEAFC